MPENIMHELHNALYRTLQEGMKKEMVQKIEKDLKDLSNKVWENFTDGLLDNLSDCLSGQVEWCATQAIKALLSGHEKEMRYYLDCQKHGEQYYGWTGRTTDHHVIRGILFETGALAIRKEIVEAYPDLLKNERILDLEDQVKSLVNQLNKLEQWEKQAESVKP